jgi:hypothetical protein
VIGPPQLATSHRGAGPKPRDGGMATKNCPLVSRAVRVERPALVELVILALDQRMLGRADVLERFRTEAPTSAIVVINHHAETVHITRAVLIRVSFWQAPHRRAVCAPRSGILPLSSREVSEEVR